MTSLFDDEGRQPERRPQRDDPADATGQPPVCEVDKRPDDIPSCDTGPLGQARFVLRELRDLWRQHQRRHGGN